VWNGGLLRRHAVSDFRLRTAPAAGMRVIVGQDLAGPWRSVEHMGLDEDTLYGRRARHELR
jgi:hypothetical protein